MKYYCAYSSLPLELSHISLGIKFMPSAELKLIHPIFQLPQSYLLTPYNSFEAGTLTPDDTKLLFLAYLNSTGLVRWDSPTQLPLTVATTFMHRLVAIATEIITVPNPTINFPSVVIDSDNATLPRIKQWIETWEEAREELTDGLRSYYRTQDLKAKERALDSIIRSNRRDTSAYASRLANWVCDATGFPTTPITLEDGTTMPCSEYWKQLIRLAGNPKTNVFTLNKGDILDIQDHLEQHLELGTIYSTAILSLIETTIARMDNFLGIDFDNPYLILRESGRALNPELVAIAEAESATIARLTDGVSTEAAPTPEQFTTKVDYLRAMAKYQLAVSSASRTTSSSI